MSAEQNKEIVRQMIAAHAAGDLQGFARYLADDCEWRYMVEDERLRQIRTKEQLIASWEAGADQTIDGLHLETTSMIAEGDQVNVELTARGQLKNGKNYHNRVVFAFVLRDRKIVEGREYIDSAHVAKIWGG